MHLVQSLPDNPLDIIGDIHGEKTALVALLGHLGYDARGRHPRGRKLVFVGDLCDRGPDSHGVIRHVQALVEHGGASVILGNHEMNLLVDDAKDGSGWFFDERHERDLKFYAPFSRTPAAERHEIRQFLGSLPVALQRHDIRIVHAAWTAEAIRAVESLPLGSVAEQFRQWDRLAQATATTTGLYHRYQQERQHWARELEDEHNPPPFLHAVAQYEATQQMINPLKVLTSGVENLTDKPFFAGNRWRFSDRVSWWNDYDDQVPVVIGHYWRMFNPPRSGAARYSLLFSGIDPISWHGKRRNVFCVDFSVGARWRDRKAGRPIGASRFRLAALQWPEKRLVFDSGQTLETS
ncbi:metallophosphoesterase [Candidimonas nitroreducens]|uniref:Metallophosphoesterase n=1 Tax=Candidimonas nitroreducens TaxID=683354 RepID=A0A225MQS8_9BURK|nr:metallophosphoesterase [Candidimonas nitroreducens]OWT63634.1 metallophosphoesterase [Candidimonas nitroreducens]